MCKIIDDILPIVGAVVGTFIAPGVGTAIGAGLGGFAGNYAQTHNFGSAALGGLVAGGTSAIGGGLGSLAANGAQSAATIAPDVFSSGVGATGAAGTTGGLESSLGGAAMFGPSAGTGTALGSTTTGLGGESLGIAGGSALSGVTPNVYTPQLGGAGTGTGLPAQTESNLNGVMASNTGQPNMAGMSGNTGTGAVGSTPTAQASPVSTLSNTGTSSMGVTPDQATAGQGMEGVQAAPAPQGGAFAAGAVNAQEPSSLSTMYGPDSMASQSPMGSAVTDNLPTGNVTANAGTLGQGKSTMDLSSLFGGNSGGGAGGGAPSNMADLYQMFQQSQANPWMKLLQTGLGAYQQFGQQNAQNAYKNQIDQEFAPNSPYAQQMQQTLARQDAAAGRNSQYGTRAVQLAAALAQAHAQALGNSNYYKAATATPGLNALNGLFANFGTNQGMQQLGQLGTSAFNGLQSLFGGG